MRRPGPAHRTLAVGLLRMNGHMLVAQWRQPGNTLATLIRMARLLLFVTTGRNTRQSTWVEREALRRAQARLRNADRARQHKEA